MIRKICKGFGYGVFFFFVFCVAMAIAYYINEQKEMKKQVTQAVQYKLERQYGKAYDILQELQSKKTGNHLSKIITDELKELEMIADNRWKELKQQEVLEDLQQMKKELDGYLTAFSYSKQKKQVKQYLTYIEECESLEHELEDLQQKKEELEEQKEKLHTILLMLKEVSKNHEKAYEFVYHTNPIYQYKAYNYIMLSWKMNAPYYDTIKEKSRSLRNYVISQKLMSIEQADMIFELIRESLDVSEAIFKSTGQSGNVNPKLLGTVKSSWEGFSSQQRQAEGLLQDEMDNHIKNIEDVQKRMHNIQQEIDILKNQLKGAEKSSFFIV